MISLNYKIYFQLQNTGELIWFFFSFFGTHTQCWVTHKLNLPNDMNSNLILCFINQRGKYRIWNCETVTKPQSDDGLKILILQFKHMIAILTFECLSNWCFIIGRTQHLRSKDLNCISGGALLITFCSYQLHFLNV